MLDDYTFWVRVWYFVVGAFFLGYAMHIETRKEAIWYKWQRSVHTNSLHQLGDVSNIYDHKLPSSSTDPLCLWPIFIHFSLWALKICT